jgi:hypothetical protein
MEGKMVVDGRERRKENIQRRFLEVGILFSYTGGSGCRPALLTVGCFTTFVIFRFGY